MPSPKNFDLLCMGRSSIDLYSNNPGSPFEEIKSFGAFVGGSPTQYCHSGTKNGEEAGPTYSRRSRPGR